MSEETLEKGLFVAGLQALRQVGGDALVEIVRGADPQATSVAAGPGTDAGTRVPLAEYLRYRDAVLSVLQDGFMATAFETGRILARNLRHERESQVRMLLAQYTHAANKLPLIGQAAVLAAKGNPGTVRAALSSPDVLAISIEKCPECRGLRRDTAFCTLNQGIMTEFAESFLGLRIDTRETSCAAKGDPRCEIEVRVAA